MDQLLEAKHVVKDSHIQRMTTALSSLRKADTADITLTCGDQQFYAHKLILEASSDYFVKMFGSNLEEAKSGSVEFREMQPNTLDAILDFIYTGEVDKIKTVQQMENVLIASHMIHLESLAQFCIEAMIASLSINNFFDIWKTLDVYECEETEKKVLQFLASIPANTLAFLPEVLDLSIDKITSILNLEKNAGNLLDDMLTLVVRWLHHDLNKREKFVKILFACLDPKLLTQVAVETVIKDETLLKATVLIQDEMKNLLYAVVTNLHDANKCDKLNAGSPHDLNLSRKKVFFFSEYISRSDNCSFHSTQGFDLQTMTWLPLKTFHFGEMKNVAMCQFEQYIYVIGGSLDASFVMYDVIENSAQYMCNCTVPRRNSSLCVFKDKLYHIGGVNANGALTSLVEGTNLPISIDTRPQWNSVLNLRQPCSNPTVITSSDCICVISSRPNYFVEYWEPSISNYTTLVRIPDIPPGIKVNVTVADNTLYALYQADGVTMQLKNTSKSIGNWCITKLTRAPPNITEVVPCQGYKTMCFVATQSIIPSFIWEPKTGNWVTLPEPKGKCQLPLSYSSKVYTAGI